MRLYTFSAHHYLKELQVGLQSTHVATRLSVKYEPGSEPDLTYREFAKYHETCIFTGVSNHAGVNTVYNKLKALIEAENSPLADLPFAIFNEDEQSMNGMATACGVVVPACYYDVGVQFARTYGNQRRAVESYSHTFQDGRYVEYPADSIEGEFITLIKSYPLA